MPSGFSLVSNLGSTSLSAGQSTSFTIQLTATTIGSFSGSIQLANNDSDENPYNLTLTGSVTAAPAPEIDITVGGVGVADGGSINFGSTTQGTTVSKTITVTNLGNATLTLTSLNAATMPSGFTLVSNLGSTSLAAGQSTTFTVRLDATGAGSFSGTIQLANNDSNENPYDLTLSGTVTAPEIDITIGGTGVADGGSINFGSTTQGTAVTKTITVTNLGNATLTLTSLNAATMPSGFSLVSNLGSTSLAAGQSTSFTIQLTATTIGSFSGSIQLANNDSDENPYNLTLTGSVTAAPAPEIDITVGGVGVADGGTVSFGSTTQGTTVSKTITVTNVGNATLTLTSLNAATMPSGFTLVSNLGQHFAGSRPIDDLHRAAGRDRRRLVQRHDPTC